MLAKFGNIINNFFKDLYENKITLLLALAILSLYGSLYVNNLSPFTIDLFNNTYFKFILFILISYTSTTNIPLAIMLTIVILLTLQQVSINNISKDSNILNKHS
jgi:hypothetical protein